MITELHPLLQAAIYVAFAITIGYFLGKILVALDSKN